ncbi:aminoglycoside phosphotransferase family protein [uncultured Streptomyces sp.]|uniref:aminoglycoside phosphotransferase family protein n=1 Tax=uncultured Streptomyces sp. TaxID=174707 RepID=UPI002613C866|nr:aminoglycoside phosphotransferase family protein [uncultured Streptomyces sp.]
MSDIPEELAATLAAHGGAAGRAFAARLPELAGHFLDRWELRPDGPPMYGLCALVLPVVRRADGLPCVLKLQAVDEETVGEPMALRAWGAAGAGAVGLLDHDPATGTMLLERLDERRPLSALPDAREAVRVLAGVLARLVAVPAPPGLRRLGDLAGGMLERTPAVLGALAGSEDRRLLADCAAALREVAAEPGDRLLHWDLHYDNVLAGRPGTALAHRWVALDPKPLAGDPGFDLFPALHNRFEPAQVRRRFDVLTEALGMTADRERARSWTLARVLQNALWAVEAGASSLPPHHREIVRQLRGGPGPR